MNTSKLAASLPILIACAALLAGCSAFSTTSNAFKSGFQATTKASSSSTGGAEDVARNNQQTVAFVRSQLPSIREEAARGEGDNVTALGHLLHWKQPQTFARWMQGHYQPLFTNLKQPQDLLARIDHLDAEADYQSK